MTASGQPKLSELMSARASGSEEQGNTSMRVPGHKRSLSPDECGIRAGQFAEAVRDDVAAAWDMMSRESRGVRQGVWATQKNIDLQEVYRAAHDRNHALFALMMADLREAILKMWPLEDLTDLGVAPTSYINDTHAFAFLPFGVTEDERLVPKGAPVRGIIIPMLLEESEWRVDLPSWRFAWDQP